LVRPRTVVLSSEFAYIAGMFVWCARNAAGPCHAVDFDKRQIAAGTVLDKPDHRTVLR
jgi:hypothetical protein